MNTLPREKICEMIRQTDLPIARMMLVIAYYVNGDDPDVASAWLLAGPTKATSSRMGLTPTKPLKAQTTRR